MKDIEKKAEELNDEELDEVSGGVSEVTVKKAVGVVGVDKTPRPQSPLTGGPGVPVVPGTPSITYKK